VALRPYDPFSRAVASIRLSPISCRRSSAAATSVGVGVMKEPVNAVTVAIDGIGELHAEFRR
jgi:hypothetical protein